MLPAFPLAPRIANALALLGLPVFLTIFLGPQAARAQDDPEAELFVSSGPETLVTLTFSAGFDTAEHFSDHQTQDAQGHTRFSSLGPAELIGSTLLSSIDGSAFADQGILRSRIQITPQDTDLYTATSTAAYTDTFTVTAPGQEGQAGQLHLEYAIDGTATGTALTLAAALSLTLIGEDNLQMTEPFSQAFGTFGEAFDITFTDEDPLTTTLDIDIVFGEPVTYGASLGLTLLGEGELDFSNTVEFVGARVTNANDQPVLDALIDSQAGIAYGIQSIPEPSTSTLLLLAGLFLLHARPRRR